MSYGYSDPRDPNIAGYSYNFDNVEATEPAPLEPLPNGIYTFVITDAPSKTNDNGRQLLTLWLKAEGNPGEHVDGKMVFDQWAMPHLGLDEPDKFRKMMGFMKAKLQAIYGMPISGDFKIVPFELITRHVRAEVRVQRQKREGEFDPATGAQLYYDPRNIVHRYLPFQAAVTAQAVPFNGGQVIPQQLTPQQQAMAAAAAPQPVPQMVPPPGAPMVPQYMQPQPQYANPLPQPAPQPFPTPQPVMQPPQPQSSPAPPMAAPSTTSQPTVSAETAQVAPSEPPAQSEQAPQAAPENPAEPPKNTFSL